MSTRYEEPNRAARAGNAVIRWLALALNGVVLVATPIQGGHHLIDLAGGGVVALCAIALADHVVRWAWRQPAPVLAVLSDGYLAR